MHDTPLLTTVFFVVSGLSALGPLAPVWFPLARLLVISHMRKDPKAAGAACLFFYALAFAFPVGATIWMFHAFGFPNGIIAAFAIIAAWLPLLAAAALDPLFRASKRVVEFDQTQPLAAFEGAAAPRYGKQDLASLNYLFGLSFTLSSLLKTVVPPVQILLFMLADQLGGLTFWTELLLPGLLLVGFMMMWRQRQSLSPALIRPHRRAMFLSGHGCILVSTVLRLVLIARTFSNIQDPHHVITYGMSLGILLSTLAVVPLAMIGFVCVEKTRFGFRA